MMNKTKLSLIIDSFFISTLTTIIIFMWLKNLNKSANYSVYLLILINLCVFIVVLILFFKLHNKHILKSNNDKFLKECLMFLILCSNDIYHNFICNLFNCKKLDNNFFKLNNNYLYINLKTNLSSSDYFFAQELFLKNKNDSSKLFFIYNNKEKSFDDILIYSKLNLEIIYSDCIIKMMEKKDLYPIKKEATKQITIKNKFKNYIKNKTSGFNKSHFKEILFSGLSLLFLSLITPFSNYYLIIGTILVCLSIITLFKKNKNTTKSNVDFLNEVS